MEYADTERAAARIADLRVRGAVVEPLEDGLRPRDEAEGYALQRAVHARLEAAGQGERVGWKIGATTRVMQDWLGIDHPCAGGVLKRAVRYGAGAFVAAEYRKPMVETEIAVSLGQDLPAAGAPYGRASVAGAVAAYRPAIELVDDRYADFRAVGVPTLIADDFFQAGAVLGLPVAGDAPLDLAAAIGRILINDRPVGDGRGDLVLGHPLEALAWLANTLAARGESLAAGEFVLLGSLVAPQPVTAGDRVAVVIDGLGEVRAAFS